MLAPSRDQAPVTDFLSSLPLTASRRALALARVLALLVGLGPLAAHAQAAGTAVRPWSPRSLRRRPRART
ncbi:hypothetical protein ACXXDK_12860 [Deinococcus sp. PESE-38]